MRVARWIILAGCLALTGAASVPGPGYVLRDGVVYRQQPGKAAQRASNYELFTQRGQKFAVCLAESNRRTELLLLKADSSGQMAALARVRGAEVNAATAIMSVRVLDDQRVFVDLHVNPSTGVGVELDTRSFKPSVYVGCGFTWDAAGRRLAYFDNGPHFTPRGECPGQVWVGHKRIKTLPGQAIASVRWQEVLEPRSDSPSRSRPRMRLAVRLEGPGGAARTITLCP